MKTLVIGAGMAGLSAARAIHDAGHDVTVIEAKDRLGGRTFTNTDIANTPVEFGAEFIHGNKVITWDLIKQAGLTTAQWHKQDDAIVQLEPEHAQQLEQDTLTMKDAQTRLADFDVTRTWGLPDEAVNEAKVGTTTSPASALRTVKCTMSNVVLPTQSATAAPVLTPQKPWLVPSMKLTAEWIFASSRATKPSFTL